MNKAQWLRRLNILLLLSLLIQSATAIIFLLELQLPHMKIYYELHEFNGLCLIALAVIHLILNWNWVRATYFSKRAS